MLGVMEALTKSCLVEEEETREAGEVKRAE